MYKHPRTHTVEAATMFAKAEELLGIDVCRQVLLDDVNLDKEAKNEGLLVFGRGMHNNYNREHTKKLKIVGVEGSGEWIRTTEQVLLSDKDRPMPIIEVYEIFG